MPYAVQRHGKKQRKRGKRGSAPPSGDSLAAYGRDAWSLAKRTAAGLNEIRKLINVEEKYIDYNFTSNPTQTGTVDYVSAIIQGTDVNQRLGDSIKLQHIEFNYGVTASGADAFVRVLLVRDMENGGASPSVANILEVNGTAKTVFSSKNFLNRNRFAVLYDETTTLTALSDTRCSYKVTIPIEKHVKYRGSSAAAGSAAEGSLYWITTTDLTTLQPAIPVYMRLTFTDD